MEATLKQKGLRITQFRLSVLAIFQKQTNAISLETIEQELVKEFDRITLYRTLKTFKEKGVIHEITFPNQQKKMALCSNDCMESGPSHKHEHLHFQCKKCDEISCIDIANYPTPNVKGFTIENIEIQASGTCHSCS